MNYNNRNQLAKIFSGLADEKRINIIKSLSDGEARSIVEIQKISHIEMNDLNQQIKLLLEAELIRLEVPSNNIAYHLNINPILSIKEFSDEINSIWGEALWKMMKSIDD